MLNLWEYSFDDGTYSHAFFIPIISIYLSYMLFASKQLIIRRTFNYLALLALITSCYLLFIFNIAQFAVGFRLSLILVLVSAIATVFYSSLRVLFPAIFLIFLVPVWGFLTALLQQLSTYVVTQIMAFTNIPTYVEGNFVAIPEGVFEIAGGCSGLRYLIVSLTISTLFIFLNIRKISHGIIFLLIAIVGALLTNWLRITLLILIGHYSNMENDLMHDHNMFGWYLYIPYMITLFYFGQQLVNRGGSTAQIKPDSLSENKKIFILPFVLTMILLLFISTLVRNKVINVRNQRFLNDCSLSTEIHSIPLPQIVNFSEICSQKIGGSFFVEYYFNPMNYNDTPSYYLNNFSPKNSIQMTHNKLNYWEISMIKNKKHRYLTAYTMVSDHKASSVRSKYKKIRVINAMKGISSARFLWLTYQCETDCQKESKKFQNILTSIVI